MATVKQYAANLWTTQVSVGQKMGVDLRRANIETRVAVLCVNVSLAIILRVLFVAGVIPTLDTALQTVLNQVLAADFPRQPENVPTPSDDTPIPNPDLGS